MNNDYANRTTHSTTDVPKTDLDDTVTSKSNQYSPICHAIDALARLSVVLRSGEIPRRRNGTPRARQRASERRRSYWQDNCEPRQHCAPAGDVAEMNLNECHVNHQRWSPDAMTVS